MANHTWLKSNERMHSDTIVFSSLILMIVTHSSKNTRLQYSSTNINTQGNQSKLFLLEHVIMFNY